MVGGAGLAGFGAAALSGVATSFSQPLATLLAGAGALGAGALAYLNGQRTRDLDETHHQAEMARERERHRDDSHRAQESALRDRYAAVAAQIAHESAAIRQAGVYALTALADDWHAFGEDDERQVCINLLQWYLRVPLPRGGDSAEPDLSEHEIRQTIVGILAQRGGRPANDPKSWSSTTINLSQTSLPGCVLTQLHFPGINWSGSNLSGVDLTRADLGNADLNQANLDCANLFGANLSGANLDGANLDGADLRGADLTAANLFGANLGGANLYDANLYEAYLNGANLGGANLGGANLTGARLTAADLRGANLGGANLYDAQLFGADLSGATGNASTRWPEGFMPPPTADI
ncbi:pentapeptide repeat-containing protein [Nocardia xishanensis]